MTLLDIALYTGVGALIWTLIELFTKNSKSFVISMLKNWVGVFFIFSAMVKLVDPMGFAIKLSDYFDVFHTPFIKPFSQLLSFVVLVLEFVLGVALLFNAKKKLTYVLLLAMLVFFAFLTGVSAIFNVVQDCGCFGDFLQMKPIMSFYKDLILLAMTLVFVWQSKYLKPWFGNAGQLGVWGLSALASLAFTLHNFYHLPMQDFRPYKIGTYIPDQMEEIEAPKYDNHFVYKNKATGKEQVFLNEFPQDADNWEFVKNDQTLISEGIPAPIHDFVFTTNNGDDITEQMLNFEKPILLIIVQKTKNAKARGSDKIRKLLKASNAGANFNYAFVSANSDAELEEWKEANGYTGTNLSADATMLKTMVRANPGLVLLKKGTVLGKWHYWDTPTPEVVESLGQ